MLYGVWRGRFRILQMAFAKSDNGIWVSGVWCMVYGVRCIVYAIYTFKRSLRRIVYDRI